MCGLGGYVDFVSGASSPAVLEAMQEVLRPRGPDGCGAVMLGPCGLAHARLSIIDLEGGAQPMRFSDSPIALVYNGEIYNFAELRCELQAAGATLRSRGDTEVLLRAIDRKWSAALPQLDGIFAFAAWDSARERLLLARDPIGVKPLFYATPEPGVLVFGSEIKTLLEHPQVDRALDHDALREVLRFRAVYGTRTLYRGVRQLEPGCWLQFDRKGIRSGRFFRLEEALGEARTSLRDRSEDQLIAQCDALLTASVRKRLVADVPVGAFLSGGLDSSLLIALMREVESPGDEICTYAVGFRDDPESETGFARTVAAAFHTRHVEVELGESDYIDTLAEVTARRDAPTSEPADLAIARMSVVAKSSVKVVLSGEGADEVFAGYPKYRFAGAPAALRFLLRLVGPDRAARLASLVALDHRRALVAARAAAPEVEIDRLVQWFSYFDRRELSRLLPGIGWSDETWSSTLEYQAEALARIENGSPMQRMQFVDCLTWLPGNLLERGDRMTMAAGLEAREPYLDKELVPFGLALQDRMKIRGLSSKWILRRIAQQRLPREIVNRPKYGFRVPLARWFRGAMRSMLRDYLTRPRGLCGTYGDLRQVQALVDEHDSGRVDRHMALWTLFAAEIWYQDVYLAQAHPIAPPVPCSEPAPATGFDASDEKRGPRA